jgi:dTDP-4-amino-4,6-dideoxygalactose transaminase
MHALLVLLKHLKLNKSDTITIKKTWDNTFVSRCVTNVVDEVCQWSFDWKTSTKAVLYIHEFGYSSNNLFDIKEECNKRNIPLIEDCAWVIDSLVSDKERVGEIGNYVIYSLPKILPVQYGGILVGARLSDTELWTDYSVLDFYKREIMMSTVSLYLKSLEKTNKKRGVNWKYLSNQFIRDGYEIEPLSHTETAPGALLLYLDSEEQMQELFSRYTNFGIETGRYYPENALYLPIHQNLNRKHLDYIYSVFRGYLNLCKDYQRNDTK